MQGFDSTPCHQNQNLPSGGVIGDWDVEETCPKVSPFTLTGVAKGPKKRGKKNEREIEEERGNERDNEPTN